MFDLYEIKIKNNKEDIIYLIYIFQQKNIFKYYSHSYNMIKLYIL